MVPYVKAQDLYQFKLALILGRGKRLTKVLKRYPTEKKFKAASVNELANVIGIKNRKSKILHKLKKLDETYDKMVTFKSRPDLSKVPDAKIIMGLDTEYLKSELDSIQYVIMNNYEIITSGFIFTNDRLAPAVNAKKGIEILINEIEEYKPEIIVGHNFNSDISVLERAYGYYLPELHFYDDTVDLAQRSNLSNIIGGVGLNNVVKILFKQDVIGLFSAYNDMSLFIEYGIKDAIYPIILRKYIINKEIPDLNLNLKIDKIVKEKNRNYLSNDNLNIRITH